MNGWPRTTRNSICWSFARNLSWGDMFAITSIDSGVLALNETEKAAGWESRGDIVYSPKSSSRRELAA